jgi:hypothetical protein
VLWNVIVVVLVGGLVRISSTGWLRYPAGTVLTAWDGRILSPNKAPT